MKTLQELLDLAKSAKPTAPKNSKWLRFKPVVNELLAKGFRLLPAIHWLAEQGAITEKQVPTVYRCLRQHISRPSK